VTRNLVAALAYLLAAGYAVKWLWRFWTPLCNEACPGALVGALYITLACIIAGALAFAAALVFYRVKLRNSVLGFSAFAASILVTVMLLTRSLNA
jgi:hypothetical protein